jgi:hypothetical protein
MRGKFEKVNFSDFLFFILSRKNPSRGGGFVKNFSKYLITPADDGGESQLKSLILSKSLITPADDVGGSQLKVWFSLSP